MKVIVGAMASCANQVQTRHFINAVTSLYAEQAEDPVDEFDRKTRKKIMRLKCVALSSELITKSCD
jgi:hypothetical protein